MPIKHTKVSALPDGPDAAQVQASDWNAAHDLSALVWGDFPTALRPVFGSLMRTGTPSPSSSAYATKGHIYTANQDLDILGVAWARGSGAFTWRPGVAKVMSLTESGGTISAVTLGTPTDGTATVLASNAQDFEMSLTAPLQVNSGERFGVFMTVTSGTGTSVNPIMTGAVDTNSFRYGASYWPNGSGAFLINSNAFTGGAASAVGLPGNAGFLIWPLARPR